MSFFSVSFIINLIVIVVQANQNSADLMIYLISQTIKFNNDNDLYLGTSIAIHYCHH